MLREEEIFNFLCLLHNTIISSLFPVLSVLLPLWTDAAFAANSKRRLRPHRGRNLPSRARKQLLGDRRWRSQRRRRWWRRRWRWWRGRGLASQKHSGGRPTSKGVLVQQGRGPEVERADATTVAGLWAAHHVRGDGRLGLEVRPAHVAVEQVWTKEQYSKEYLDQTNHGIIIVVKHFSHNEGKSTLQSWRTHYNSKSCVWCTANIMWIFVQNRIPGVVLQQEKGNNAGSGGGGRSTLPAIRWRGAHFPPRSKGAHASHNGEEIAPSCMEGR